MSCDRVRRFREDRFGFLPGSLPLAKVAVAKREVERGARHVRSVPQSLYEVETLLESINSISVLGLLEVDAGQGSQAAGLSSAIIGESGDRNRIAEDIMSLRVSAQILETVPEPLHGHRGLRVVGRSCEHF